MFESGGFRMKTTLKDLKLETKVGVLVVGYEQLKAEAIKEWKINNVYYDDDDYCQAICN